VESDNDKILLCVHWCPSETECQTAGDIPAVSTKLGMTQVTASSVDCWSSATKHSEGAKADSGIAPALYDTSPHAGTDGVTDLQPLVS
jgi:hypothetical protein